MKVVVSAAETWKILAAPEVSRMAMGKKKGRQGRLWIATSDLARSPGHPFYERLNRLLAEHGFDAFVEAQCRRFEATLNPERS